MPFALLLAGLMMVITGAQNTYVAFGEQLRKDFTGPGNFTYWLASLGAVGAVGYIPKLRPISIAFMTLIVVVLFLSNKGVFAKASQALAQGPVAPAQSSTPGIGGALGNTLTNFMKSLIPGVPQ